MVGAIYESRGDREGARMGRGRGAKVRTYDLLSLSWDVSHTALIQTEVLGMDTWPCQLSFHGLLYSGKYFSCYVPSSQLQHWRPSE